MTNKLGPVAVSDKVLLIGGGVAVALVIAALWYAKSKLGDAAAAVGDAAGTAAHYVAHDAVNVTSHDNVANVAVNALGQAIGVFGTNDVTGQPNTLGSAIFEAGQWGKETFGSWW